ncbi:hypothetical protein TWF696_007269 [Orbilia brochopaga]|uniref:LYR motif-containing protein 2 n=1 Tax=Orbilia brochopaga TaxID=3140254 RepID=A0AAV9US61_9PEZI
MIPAARRYASGQARGAGPKMHMGLDWFIQRARVLALWRDILRRIRCIEDANMRAEMRTWARHEFKRNKDVQDTTQIRYLISVSAFDFLFSSSSSSKHCTYHLSTSFQAGPTRLHLVAEIAQPACIRVPRIRTTD